MLTTIQFDILALLMKEPGRVFNRSAILHAASGSDFEGYERTVDAHIKNIRKALSDDDEQPRWIGTVRGIGYKFLEQDHDTPA
jgi:DNA-binding response OmpR family regulator